MSESNGRKIAHIAFEEDGRTDPILRSTPEEWLQWHEDYHGTHDIAWVVQIRNGLEIARFNPRYLAAIVWSVPETEVKP